MGRSSSDQNQPGRDQRERNRQDADQRDAPLEEEQRQNHDDENRSEDERPRQVVDRVLDEGGWSEDRRVDLDARQARLEVFQRGLDAAGDLERVGPGELLDDKHQSPAAVDHRVADEQLVVDLDVGEVSELHGLGPGPCQGDLAELLCRHHRRNVADAEPLVGGVDEAPRSDHGPVRPGDEVGDIESVRRAFENLVDADAELLHPLWLDLNLQLM